MSPLIGVTARRLHDGRVTGWTGAGIGERDRYLERVRHAGGLPVLLDPAPFDDDESARTFVNRFDGILLTGGPDVEPHRYGQDQHETVYGTDETVDAFELALARAAHATSTPLLAICRGLQVLNVAFGGTLHQHIPMLDGVEPHGRPGHRDGERHHRVTLTSDSRIVTVMGTATPVSSCHHHQAVDVVAPGWQVVGTADDGIVEAIEPTGGDWFALAVQWHPEDTAPDDPAQRALFEALVAGATAVSGSRG